MDAASGIGFPVAFGAGLISFLSPCVLPLVPGYISAVAGGQPGEIQTRRVIGPSLAFVGSFSFIFIVLGLLGPAGAARRAHRAGGAQDLRRRDHRHGRRCSCWRRSCRRSAANGTWSGLMQRAGRGGPVLTGAAFALAWTPCTGPTLGAIVTAAGTSNSASRGAVLLAVYCAGLGVPFLITGLAFGSATSAFAVIKRHYPLVIGTGGAVLIAMGVLIWTGEFTQLNITVSHWLRPSGCRTSTATPEAPSWPSCLAAGRWRSPAAVRGRHRRRRRSTSGPRHQPQRRRRRPRPRATTSVSAQSTATVRPVLPMPPPAACAVRPDLGDGRRRRRGSRPRRGRAALSQHGARSRAR